MTSDFDDEVKVVLADQLAHLIGRLPQLPSIADTSGERRNRAIVSALDHMHSDTSSVSSGPMDSAVVRNSAAGLFQAECPVQVREEDAVAWMLLRDVDPGSCRTVVVSAVVNSATFAVYARAKNLGKWIVAGSSREVALIKRSWPHDERLDVISDTQGLFSPDLMPENRVSPTLKILRGDYALADSALFGDAFFVRLPGGRVPRHVGMVLRRSDIPATQQPRVYINAIHPLIVEIDAFLKRADDDGFSQMQQWLDSLCEGVLEDDSKLAPAARWAKLREQFGNIAGSVPVVGAIERIRV